MQLPIYYFGVYAAYAKVFAKQEEPRTIVGMLQKWMFLLNCHISLIHLFLVGSVLNERGRSRKGWPARNATFLRES